MIMHRSSKAGAGTVSATAIAAATSKPLPIRMTSRTAGESLTSRLSF
jgi:hypothetical protein